MPQPRCPYCGTWFTPWPGKGPRQVTCGNEACRRAHKAALNRQWLANDPGAREARYKKVLDRRREEGYWRKHRAGDPDYVERNREQTRERMRALRARRKEAAQVLKDPLRFLDGLRVPAEGLFATQELARDKNDGKSEGTRARPTMFATQELAAGLSVGLWRYLWARERFATRGDLDGKAEGTV